MSVRRGVLPSVLACFAAAGRLCSAQEPPPAHPELYQEALQSMSEGRKNDASKQFRAPSTKSRCTPAPGWTWR